MGAHISAQVQERRGINPSTINIRTNFSSISEELSPISRMASGQIDILWLQPANSQEQSQCGAICWRLKKVVHRWRQFPQPSTTILEAAKTYLTENPKQAINLVPIVAAQCDDSYCK